MTARTVTGKTVLPSGSAQTSQTVTFVKRSTTISGITVTQASPPITATTNSSGEFSASLDCPADGSTQWTIIYPDGGEFDFTLPYGDGSSVAVTTLISAATVDADAVTLLLDGYEPDLGNPGTSGHVLSSTTAGVRSWVAQSGGSENSLVASDQSGVDKTGATDSTVGLQNAITAAAALGHKSLYLPAGTYSITGNSGTILALSSGNFKLFGDGVGKTIIKLADSRTLTGHMALIRLSSSHQSVEGITINCGTGHTVSTYEIAAVSLYENCTYAKIRNVEIYNVAGGTSAGGIGLATYQPYTADDGYQYAYCENVLVRDSASATGFAINSNGNTFLNCHAIDVGNASTKHGFYAQGGDNLYDGCRAERCGGYSFHLYKLVPNLDASGDRLIGCASIDPVYAHAIVQGTTNSLNPDIPASEALTRYTTITGCLFKTTGGGTLPIYYGVSLSAAGCVFSDNLIEDAAGNATVWVDSQNGTDCVIANNVFRKLNSAITNDIVMRLGIRCTAENNRLLMGTKVVANFFQLNGIHARSINNLCVGAGGKLALSANNTESFGDKIISTGSATIITITAGLTGVKVFNGYFETASGTIMQLGATGVIFQNCTWTPGFRVDAAGATFINCVGTINIQGNTGYSFDERALMLANYPNSSVSHTGRRLVKLASGSLAPTITSDTVFIGITPSGASATTNPLFIIQQPGAVASVDTDGAWTAGNYGIVSPTVAGKIHDSGASPPASGSYVLFLDTGGSAGVATVRLVKTI